MSRSKRAKIRRSTRNVAKTKARRTASPRISPAEETEQRAPSSAPMAAATPSLPTSSQPLPPVRTGQLRSEDDLPEEMYVAYELRQRGAKTAEIAAQLGKSRRTIFRWFQAVDEEALERFRASQPAAHVMELAETFADLERTARRNLCNAAEERDKRHYTEQALRAAKARCDLLAKSGLLKAV